MYQTHHFTNIHFFGLIILFGGIFLLSACKNSDKASTLPKETTPPSTSLTKKRIPIAVQFLNADIRPNVLQPDKVKVIITYGIEGLVGDLSNTDTVAVNKGFTNFLLPLSAVADNQTYTFTLKVIDPENYFLSTTKTIIVSNQQKEGLYVPVYMANIKDPKNEVKNPGMRIVNQNYSIKGGIKNALSIKNVPKKRDASVWGEITIPAGTQLFDTNGNLISGNNLNATFGLFDGRFPVPFNAFPNSLYVHQGVDIEGQTHGKFYFQTFGWSWVNMVVTNGSTTIQVDSFSNSIGFKIAFSSETAPYSSYPSLSDTAYTRAEVWKLNENNGHWRQIADNLSINNTPSASSVSFSIRHLSQFAFTPPLDSMMSTCDTEITIDNSAHPFRIRHVSLNLNNPSLPNEAIRRFGLRYPDGGLISPFIHLLAESDTTLILTMPSLPQQSNLSVTVHEDWRSFSNAADVLSITSCSPRDTLRLNPSTLHITRCESLLFQCSLPDCTNVDVAWVLMNMHSSNGFYHPVGKLGGSFMNFDLAGISNTFVPLFVRLNYNDTNWVDLKVNVSNSMTLKPFSQATTTNRYLGRTESTSSNAACDSTSIFSIDQ